MLVAKTGLFRSSGSGGKILLRNAKWPEIQQRRQ